MGQSLLINISDKPQKFYKFCMNENCQLSIKEYLCWVSFWFVTFPCEKTEFNASFILTRRYTLRGTIFFTVAKGVTSFHSFIWRQVLLGKYEILQPIRTDSALSPRVWNSLELALEQEIWRFEVWSFFFHKVYLENVNKIVHYIRCCIRHSILFRTVFMICIDDFCNGGTISLKWVTVRSLSEMHGSQHSRVQRGRLHWQWPSLQKLWLMHFIIGLFTFAFKKDFKQPFLIESELG